MLKVKNCQKCGLKNHHKSTNCSKCGELLPERVSLDIGLVVAIVILVLVLGSGVTVASDYYQKPTPTIPTSSINKPTTTKVSNIKPAQPPVTQVSTPASQTPTPVVTTPTPKNTPVTATPKPEVASTPTSPTPAPVKTCNTGAQNAAISLENQNYNNLVQQLNQIQQNGIANMAANDPSYMTDGGYNELVAAMQVKFSQAKLQYQEALLTIENTCY